MTRCLRSITLSLLLCTVVAGAPVKRIDPDNPPQGRFSDEWAEVHMAGGKVGYLHSSMNRDGNVIRTETATRMKMGRVDSPVEIHIVQKTEETLAGVPIAFGTQMHAAAMQTTTKGTVRDGKVTIVTSQFGMDQTQQFDFPVGSVMAWGQFREGLKRGFKPGTKYTLPVYSPDLRLDGSIDAVTTVGEWETFEHGKKRLKGQRVTVEMLTPVGTMELTSWVDKHGWPIKAKVPAPGLGDMVILTTDQASALADFLPPEIFMSTTIKARRKINPKTTDRIAYRIRTTEPSVDLAVLPATGMQEAKMSDDGAIELTVRRQSHGGKKQRGASRKYADKTPALSEKDLEEYLLPNLMINTEDPELIKLAKKAAGNERDPYALADRLREFVSDYVTTQSLGVGFATASEVCRTREGDCSEYGVLLAALGRIHKLPSRVVVGLAYVPSFGGEEDIFGYHMWTQFFIDGRWVDVDAALNETECSPARIAFATSSLRHTGLADLSLPLITKIGAIDIDILEVE